MASERIAFAGLGVVADLSHVACGLRGVLLEASQEVDAQIRRPITPNPRGTTRLASTSGACSRGLATALS